MLKTSISAVFFLLLRNIMRPTAEIMHQRIKNNDRIKAIINEQDRQNHSDYPLITATGR